MKPLFEDLRTEEQRALAATIRRFVHTEVGPYLAASPKDEFPRPLFSRLCAMGLGGIPFPAEFGGGGADYATYALVLEELAVGSGALAGTLSVHGLPQLILSRFGSEDQKRRYLPRLAAGELLGAFALTEPETGSDAAAIATRASADPDGFLISGSKAWITHSTVADLFVVFARTGEEEISAFLVEKGTSGFTPLPPERKTGLRRSPTGGLSLAGVRVADGRRAWNRADRSRLRAHHDRGARDRALPGSTRDRDRVREDAQGFRPPAREERRREGAPRGDGRAFGSGGRARARGRSPP
jgi:alkylation response protein AidB-like acyl-CoA dehydrogenase